MWIERKINEELQELSKTYSAVTVLGPRQVGKSSLVRRLFPDHTYINLENPEIRDFALHDPAAFFRQYRTPMTLDEIQRAPSLLSYIQLIVDNNKAKGQFILTGSHQLELSQAITQSLAGRTAIAKLLPLSLEELTQANFKFDATDYIFNGFMPAIYGEEIVRIPNFYRNYFQTYVERDVRQLINVKDFLQFETFIKLCAGRVGQILNYNSLAADVGVSVKTAQHWFSILEASFIVFRLAPYYENFGKRLIKSPKLYFTELGLATYLLGIENRKQIATHPLRGALFENMVILELVKARENRGLDPNLYFFRDSNGNEVDVIFKSSNKLRPIEIKSSETFNKDFLKGINYFKAIAGKQFDTGAVIYAGHLTPKSETYKVFNFLDSAKIFEF